MGVALLRTEKTERIDEQAQRSVVKTPLPVQKREDRGSSGRHDTAGLPQSGVDLFVRHKGDDLLKIDLELFGTKYLLC